MGMGVGKSHLVAIRKKEKGGMMIQDEAVKPLETYSERKTM